MYEILRVLHVYGYFFIYCFFSTFIIVIYYLCVAMRNNL